MIFVTLGSQKFQFNRLLETVDNLIERKIIADCVFAQTGYSDYKPKNYAYKDFLDYDEFADIETKAQIIITHGGTGAIIGAVKQGKKVIAVPRLAKFKEHVDDHQLQLIAQFKNQNLICGLDDCSQLEAGLEYVNSHTFDSYISSTRSIMESIDRFIEYGIRNRELYVGQERGNEVFKRL